jgi:peptidoglycan hydrolase-like protein with peptidoglycan-binding domain
VKVRNLVNGPREVRSPIEAEYSTVTKTVMTEPSYMEWRQILCETNMTRTNVLEIQKSLEAKGYNPGPLDGIYGRLTTAAVNKFQADKGLARGQLTVETVEALGLQF